MDQQFFRKNKEAKIAYAAKHDEETGRFSVVRRHRPSGRVKVVAETVDKVEAGRIRNALIQSSDELEALGDN